MRGLGRAGDYRAFRSISLKAIRRLGWKRLDTGTEDTLSVHNPLLLLRPTPASGHSYRNRNSNTSATAESSDVH
jgi:hypothetical protein